MAELSQFFSINPNVPWECWIEKFLTHYILCWISLVLTELKAWYWDLCQYDAPENIDEHVDSLLNSCSKDMINVSEIDWLLERTLFDNYSSMLGDWTRIRLTIACFCFIHRDKCSCLLHSSVKKSLTWKVTCLIDESLLTEENLMMPS